MEEKLIKKYFARENSVRCSKKMWKMHETMCN